MAAASTADPRASQGLRRSIGPIGAALSGVGIILGAGIYVLIGEPAGLTGNILWLAFLLGAILATATGLSYCELATMYPEAGASAAYTHEAFGPQVAFVCGWMTIVVALLAASTVAIGFGGYLAELVGGPERAFALAALLLCTAIALVGPGETVRVAGTFAIIEAGGLLAVIAFGLPHIGDANLLASTAGLGGVLAAAAVVFFAYQSFEQIATLAEEVHNPSRNLPLAFMVAITITGVLYVAVAVVAVSVVDADALAEGSAPLALVMETAAGGRAADALAVGALFATFNTVLLSLATGARSAYGMAQRGLLPRILARAHEARQTPWVAVLVGGALASGLALVGGIGYLAQVTNFAVLAIFIAVNAAVVRLRFSQPSHERPFRLPLAPGRVPVSAAVALFGAVTLAAFVELEALLNGIATLAVGIALSFIAVRGERAGAS
ncbi:MAG: amino acid permease [Chloroflexi bacterium]|nr:MAG: amino acid permease [Chloroflexota bacterium]